MVPAPSLPLQLKSKSKWANAGDRDVSQQPSLCLQMKTCTPLVQRLCPVGLRNIWFGAALLPGPQHLVIAVRRVGEYSGKYTGSTLNRPLLVACYLEVSRPLSQRTRRNC